MWEERHQRCAHSEVTTVLPTHPEVSTVLPTHTGRYACRTFHTQGGIPVGHSTPRGATLPGTHPQREQHCLVYTPWDDGRCYIPGDDGRCYIPRDAGRRRLIPPRDARRRRFIPPEEARMVPYTTRRD